MFCAAITTDFIPDAHILLMIVHCVSFGKPANLAACLAGACPKLPCSTLPIYTCSTSAGFSFILSIAAFMAAAPILGAAKPD